MFKAKVRNFIASCMACARLRSKVRTQMMGNLAAERLLSSRPFLQTGVDYAGPFAIRASKEHGHSSYKGYIWVFVCFSTRATHLELVSDYSSQAFVAAYRPFVGRRGRCSDMYSDCGTTFVGANAELRSMSDKCLHQFD